ncbi:MAG: response regulator transcription factor [Bacteroidetes bacterium]|nr:MAG: response regulator transcription factor [Bacteroidota bacterium]
MNKQKKVTIIIADDHPIFRKGVKDIVSENEKFIVIGEAGDGEEVLSMVKSLQSDILLLDLNLPSINGLEVAEKLREAKLPTKIVILTMHKDEALFTKALDSGVFGYILKESASREVLDALQSVCNDEHYISPALSSYLVKRSKKTNSFYDEKPSLDTLTQTERKILKLISEQKTSNAIADELFISLRTVENHRQNICNKLNIHGVNALLKFAIENKSTL